MCISPLECAGHGLIKTKPYIREYRFTSEWGAYSIVVSKWVGTYISSVVKLLLSKPVAGFAISYYSKMHVFRMITSNTSFSFILATSVDFLWYIRHTLRVGIVLHIHCFVAHSVMSTVLSLSAVPLVNPIYSEILSIYGSPNMMSSHVVIEYRFSGAVEFAQSLHVNILHCGSETQFAWCRKTQKTGEFIVGRISQ